MAVPFTAAMLQVHCPLLLSQLQILFGTDADSVAELDIVWMGIVMQQVPSDALHNMLNDGEQTVIAEIARRNGVLADEIKDVRMLYRADKVQTKELVSVRLMISREDIVQQLINLDIFVFTTHCRILFYCP